MTNADSNAWRGRTATAQTTIVSRLRRCRPHQEQGATKWNVREERQKVPEHAQRCRAALGPQMSRMERGVGLSPGRMAGQSLGTRNPFMSSA